MSDNFSPFVYDNYILSSGLNLKVAEDFYVFYALRAILVCASTISSMNKYSLFTVNLLNKI